MRGLYFFAWIGYSLHMMKKIEEKAEALIRKYNMIEKDDVVIAGVSGGADSVCLLFVLCALRETYDFSVRVCHVNHGLRGADADADERFVEALCRELKVPCRVFRRDVELIARKRKQSTEEAGRTVRREAFETMCREEGGTRIASDSEDCAASDRCMENGSVRCWAFPGRKSSPLLPWQGSPGGRI